LRALFDNSLAWMSIGFAGIVVLAFGLTGPLAPTWFLVFRRRFLANAPAWQRRVASIFDSALGASPRIGPVRIIGGVTVVIGIAFLVIAGLTLTGG
jgi:hypothetical protein